MLSAESTYATFLWIVIGFDGTILLSQQSHSLPANPLHFNVDLSEKLANVRGGQGADAGEPVVGRQPESQSEPGVRSNFNQMSPQSGGKVWRDGASHLLLKLLLADDVVDRWTDFIDGVGRWAKDS